MAVQVDEPLRTEGEEIMLSLAVHFEQLRRVLDEGTDGTVAVQQDTLRFVRILLGRLQGEGYHMAVTGTNSVDADVLEKADDLRTDIHQHICNMKNDRPVPAALIGQVEELERILSVNESFFFSRWMKQLDAVGERR